MSLESYIRDRLKKKPLLVMTHAVVGYPSLEANWQMLEGMAQAGVDVVELQLPFSEPIADGPSFVRANQEALDHELRWNDYFELFARAAKTFDFPLLFMGYYNSVFQMGDEVFCERLADAGAQGYILADLPPQEATALHGHGRSRQLDPILLMTPTNADARLKEIAAQASGFVYCVARKGVTGKQTDLATGVEAFLQRCRSATELPLALGFGVKSADNVAELRGLADIAIVGTACLEVWEREGGDGYREFLRTLTAASA